MHWYQYLSLGCLLVCFAACLWHLFRLIKLGNPKDLSQKKGNILQAQVYSCTTAMMPTHKESAYLHIPTYAGGILFHIGTFICLAFFVLSFFVSPDLFPCWLKIALIGIIGVGTVSGFALFIKRFIIAKVRNLSNPDDYISNLLTTLAQVASLLYIYGECFAIYYYCIVSLLLLYIPVGKLRHVIYFFAARYHLGYFYGWRNSWPPKMED